MLISLMNAFILIPVVLSLVGPVPDFEEKKQKRRQSFMARRSQMSEQMALAIE